MRHKEMLVVKKTAHSWGWGWTREVYYYFEEETWQTDRRTDKISNSYQVSFPWKNREEPIACSDV